MMDGPKILPGSATFSRRHPRGGRRSKSGQDHGAVLLVVPFDAHNHAAHLCLHRCRQRFGGLHGLHDGSRLSCRKYAVVLGVLALCQHKPGMKLNRNSGRHRTTGSADTRRARRLCRKTEKVVWTSPSQSGCATAEKCYTTAVPQPKFVWSITINASQNHHHGCAAVSLANNSIARVNLIAPGSSDAGFQLLLTGWHCSEKQVAGRR